MGMLSYVKHIYWSGPGFYVFNKKPGYKVEVFRVASEEYGRQRGYNDIRWLDNAPDGIVHRENVLVGYGT